MIDHKDLKPGWYWAKYYLDECFICVEIKQGKHRLFLEHETEEVWTHLDSYEFICRIPSADYLLCIEDDLNEMNMAVESMRKLLRGEE